MLRLFCLLVLLSTPAWGYSGERLLLLYQQVRSQPELLPQSIASYPSHSDNSVSDRYLLLANAAIRQHDLASADAHLQRLQGRNLSQLQKGWLKLLKSERAELFASKVLSGLAEAKRASKLLAPLSSKFSQQLYFDSLLLQARQLDKLKRNPQTLQQLQLAQVVAANLGELEKARLNAYLGQFYRRMGQYQLAVDHFQIALALEPKVNDLRFSVELYLRLSDLYLGLSDMLNAMHFSHRAAELSEPIPYLHSIAMTQLAEVYQQQLQFEQAVHYLLLAQTAIAQTNSPLQLATVHLSLSESYLAMAQFGKARSYLDSAEVTFKQLGHEHFKKQAMLTEIRLLLAEQDGRQALALIEQFEATLMPNSFRHQLLKLKAQAYHLLGDYNRAWQLLLKFSDTIRYQAETTGKETLKQLAKHHLRQRGEQQQQHQRQQQSKLDELNFYLQILTLTIVILLLALLVSLRRIRKQRDQESQVQHLLYHQTDVALPNRNALIQQMPQHRGMLVLIQLGNLPNMELQLGRGEFIKLRQQIAIRLGTQEGLKQLYETSPGRFAMVIDGNQRVQFLTGLLERIDRWSLRRHCGNGRIAIGAIDIPFQPGSLLQLPPECSIQLVQLALCGAIEQTHHFNQHAYLLLQPATLNAPVLNPSAIYQSAQKSIQNGVIRCISNLPTAQIRWPSGAISKFSETD